MKWRNRLLPFTRLLTKLDVNIQHALLDRVCMDKHKSMSISATKYDEFLGSERFVRRINGVRALAETSGAPEGVPLCRPLAENRRSSQESLTFNQ